MIDDKHDRLKATRNKESNQVQRSTEGIKKGGIYRWK